MTQNPRVPPDLLNASVEEEASDRPKPIPAALSPQNVAEIARQLAAHGGGAASLDLAFDLVFHEVVEEARDTTGATGAAIALLRDDEMVCRATTGDNAPDLGVRVETSGLAGECVRTGVTQHSEETEVDPRV